MNIKLISFALLFAATSAMAAESTDTAMPTGLDIQRVMSVTPIPGSCQVEPATMIYVDSHGVQHSFNYQVMGTCQGGI